MLRCTYYSIQAITTTELLIFYPVNNNKTNMVYTVLSIQMEKFQLKLLFIINWLLQNFTLIIN